MASAKTNASAVPECGRVPKEELAELVTHFIDLTTRPPDPAFCAARSDVESIRDSEPQAKSR
jgi:hypothetical protein